MANKAMKIKTADSEKSSANPSAGTAGSQKSLEARFAQLLDLPNEEEAAKIFETLKAHGLNKSQVIQLVEAIRREENEITYGERVIKGELQTNQEDLMDEADLASSDIEQGMKMRMANRENFKAKRLHRTLDKIRDGSYGECESCSADIGFARLSARTIAELCIACKEEQERKENLSSVGRKPKSMGQTLGSKMTVN